MALMEVGTNAGYHGVYDGKSPQWRNSARQRVDCNGAFDFILFDACLTILFSRF